MPDVSTAEDDGLSPALDADYLTLIGSDRVSERLRRELLNRARIDDPAYRPQVLTAEQFALLRAVVNRVIPQTGPNPIDLAARLDAMMAAASGNGWRYEALPGDPDAYRLGLDTLNGVAASRHGCGFRDLAGEAQDAVLEGITEGRAFEAAPLDRGLNSAQMTRWFEELRSDVVRFYAAHPATMARLAYAGIANGGASGADFTGFRQIGIGEREPWEPIRTVEAAS